MSGRGRDAARAVFAAITEHAGACQCCGARGALQWHHHKVKGKATRAQGAALGVGHGGRSLPNPARGGK